MKKTDQPDIGQYLPAPGEKKKRKVIMAREGKAHQVPAQPGADDLALQPPRTGYVRLQNDRLVKSTAITLATFRKVTAT